MLVLAGECHLWDIFGMNLQLVITRMQIDLQEYTSTLKLNKEILNTGQWMLVHDGDCVQIPIIDAHSLRTILLLYEQYRKNPRREAATDIALG
jgi:hypothetical protein